MLRLIKYSRGVIQMTVLLVLWAVSIAFSGMDGFEIGRRSDMGRRYSRSDRIYRRSGCASVSYFPGQTHKKMTWGVYLL